MKTDKRILEILEQVVAGGLSPAKAAVSIEDALAVTGDLGFAKVDLDREARTGFPEVIYGEGKEPRHVAEIAETVFARSQVLLVTRTNEEAFRQVREKVHNAAYNPTGRLIFADARKPKPAVEGVTIVAAGTSDLPVAEEAAATATLMGCTVARINDVGVAGLHRLLSRLDELRHARVLVVVAGMEGALASVVAGLVKAPVIGVPTSVGYGANFGGVAALLAMLNSCSLGVTVVNIDNGVAAGYAAALIAGANDPARAGSV